MKEKVELNHNVNAEFIKDSVTDTDLFYDGHTYSINIQNCIFTEPKQRVTNHSSALLLNNL